MVKIAARNVLFDEVYSLDSLSEDIRYQSFIIDIF